MEQKHSISGAVIGLRACMVIGAVVIMLLIVADIKGLIGGVIFAVPPVAIGGLLGGWLGGKISSKLDSSKKVSYGLSSILGVICGLIAVIIALYVALAAFPPGD